MQAIKSELLELLRRNDYLRASLSIAKIQDATFPVEEYVEKLRELAARCWHQASTAKSDPVLQAEIINRVLFEEFGLVGKSDRNKNVIDDPDRYYLHSVLDRRMGSSLAIAVIYTLLADQIGLAMECYALPSHYYLKVKDAVGDFYIDPFDGGKLITEEDFQRRFRSVLQRGKLLSASLYEKVTPHQLVARLVQQLKHVYILKGSALEALRAVELLTAFFPASPELTRDRGILYCEIEYFSKAMEDLRFYLAERPNANDVSEIKKLTQMLKGCREIIN